MDSRSELLRAIDTLDHRLERAMSAYHNVEQWDTEEVCEGDGFFIGTYSEWIDAAFANLRRVEKEY